LRVAIFIRGDEGKVMDSMSQDSRRPSTSHLEGLLERMKAGDESAKEELIRDAYPSALRLTRVILKDKRDAFPQGHSEDICLVSYEKFAKKMREGLKESFANTLQMMEYLKTTIRRTVLDEFKKMNGPVFKTQFPDGQLPPEFVTRIGLGLRFHEMIEGLPEDEQFIVNMVYQDSYNYTEIAQLMGLGRIEVGRKYMRAIKRLRAEFDAHGPDREKRRI